MLDLSRRQHVLWVPPGRQHVSRVASSTQPVELSRCNSKRPIVVLDILEISLLLVSGIEPCILGTPSRSLVAIPVDVSSRQKCGGLLISLLTNNFSYITPGLSSVALSFYFKRTQTFLSTFNFNLLATDFFSNFSTPCI